MFKIVINNALLPDYTVLESPKGWEDFTFTLTRSYTYKTITKSFISGITLLGQDKTYIETIYREQGYFSEILLSLYVLDQTTKIYELFYKGKINYKTVISNKYDVTFDVINGSFEDKIFAKEDNLIEYLRQTDYDGNAISPLFNPLFNINITQFANHICKAVKPFDLFQKVIYTITGQSECFKSYFFDYNNVRTDMSKGKYAFLTSGKYLTQKEDSGGVSVTLKELFTNMSKIYGLGMCIEFSDYNHKWVRIDKLELFYNPQIVATFDSISDLEYSLNENYLFDKIQAGYIADNQPNDIASNEYNTQSNYSLNIGTNDGILDLVSTYRADGTAMKLAIDEVVNEDTEGKYDKDVFIINCVKSGNDYVSSQATNMDLVDGLTSVDQLIMNAEITPANMILNNGQMIRIPTIDKIGKIIFSKNQQRTKIRTKRKDEIYTVTDCTDLDYSILGVSYLSPYRLKFNVSPSYNDLKNISNNPHGLIKIYDYISKKYVYGWINEFSSNILDKTTNVELQLANKNIYQNMKLLTNSNNRLVNFTNGGNILLQ